MVGSVFPLEEGPMFYYNGHYLRQTYYAVLKKNVFTISEHFYNSWTILSVLLSNFYTTKQCKFTTLNSEIGIYIYRM